VTKMRLQGTSRKGNDLVAVDEVERGSGNKQEFQPRAFVGNEE
jgi:hypothetical protein